MSSHSTAGLHHWQAPPTPPTTRSTCNRRVRYGLASIPVDILLEVVCFLDVRHVLVLRRVCKQLASATQSHAVWLTMVNDHVIKSRLPWPPWALPMTDVPACTMEKLCIRAIRLETHCWDKGDSKVQNTRLLCLYQEGRSVTWINISRSRWLIAQVNSRLFEFWDLENPSDSPRAVLDGILDAIDGSKLLLGPDTVCLLVVSTKSYQAHALRLHLPGPGVPECTPQATITGTWEGYSTLLDASGTLWAFGKERTKQVAMILQSASGRSVRLATANPDELCNLPGAIQILPGTVAVARTSCLDIYDMSTILSALDFSSTCQPKTLHPTQTLAYPANWIANHSYFAPIRPKWVRSTELSSDDICLIFTEPYLETWVALVARRERSPDKEVIKHRLEEPYYLFTPESYATAATSWGESARRLTYVVNDIEQILLVGAFIPSDPSLFGIDGVHTERVTRLWSIPEGGIDYAQRLAFDEFTGIAAISMASGRLWVIDPAAPEERRQIPGERPTPPHPDPTWPYLHATPWPPTTQRLATSKTSEELEPEWSTSVEQYFPGKNRPDCFGGAKWFVNEIWDIEGSATTVIFTVPHRASFPSLEVVRVGQRLLLIQRDEDTYRYEAKALSTSMSLEDVLTHFRTGGVFEGLSGTALSVDESPGRRYSLWRARTESTACSYF